MELLTRRVRPGSQLIYFCEHSLPFDTGPLVHSELFLLLFSLSSLTQCHTHPSVMIHHCHCHYYCDHQYHHCYYHYYITIFTIIAAITSLISFTALASFTTRLTSFIRLTLSTSFHLGLLFSSYWLFFAKFAIFTELTFFNIFKFWSLPTSLDVLLVPAKADWIILVIWAALYISSRLYHWRLRMSNM